MPFLLAVLIGVWLIMSNKKVLQPAEETTVKALAEAIARAEGYYVSNSLPQRANNPGDLKMGDVGYGTISGKTVYGTDAEGWQALYKQCRLMLTGASSYYRPDMTILQVAAIYTGNDKPDSWANAVAQSLGVTTGTKLNALNV